MTDQTQCTCCGSIVPFPQSPGVWKYCYGFDFVFRGEDNIVWTIANIVASTDEPGSYECHVDGQAIWWPEKAIWRKLDE